MIQNLVSSDACNLQLLVFFPRHLPYCKFICCLAHHPKAPEVYIFNGESNGIYLISYIIILLNKFGQTQKL